MRLFKRKHQSPCRVGFHKFCDTVKRIEGDKDAFLKAARLQRHEAPPVVTANNVLKVAAIFGGTIILSALIVCAYLSGNSFVQTIAAGVSLLSFLFVGMGLSE